MLVAFAWSNWLSLVALVISLVSIGLAIRADHRAGRGEGRDVERLQRERDERDAANRAALAIWPNGSTTSIDERRYAYIIRNHGKVKAYDVHVWLYDEDGNDLTIKPQAGYEVGPDEAIERYGVSVPPDVEPMQVRFGVNWHDGTGYQARLLHVPPML
jgi:hypothetical protein